MSGTTVRNIAIIVALAALVAFLPGGETGANLVSQLLSAVFVVLIAFILGQLYRRFRSDIYGLGDRWRLVLYGCIGAIVVALACASRLLSNSGAAGIAIWFALMGGAAYGLYATWRHYREYSF
jgi:predicted Na+-dependent transporter